MFHEFENSVAQIIKIISKIIGKILLLKEIEKFGCFSGRKNKVIINPKMILPKESRISGENRFLFFLIEIKVFIFGVKVREKRIIRVL